MVSYRDLHLLGEVPFILKSRDTRLVAFPDPIRLIRSGRITSRKIRLHSGMGFV